MPRTFFTSDQHFGHANIIEYSARPFRDVPHMNEEMIRRHNFAVSSEDIVYHLGDFTMNDKFMEATLRRLNGHHRLVVGNHDPCHPIRSKHLKERRRYLDAGFETVDIMVELELPGGIPVIATHMPYVGDSHERERYSEWRPKDNGLWLLHGHVHEKWRIRDRMLNVGVDQWDFTPVAAEVVARTIREHS